MTGPEHRLGDDVLTLQEAADRLRVHYMTAYRWVRRGALPAFKAGGRLRVRAGDLEQFAREREVDVALRSAGTGRRDWDRHVGRLHTMLVGGETTEASNLVTKVVADGASATDVYIHLIAPAMYRIGDDWEAGRIGVATEHRATEIATRLVTRLGESFRRRGPRRGTAVTMTPAGEHHVLGTAMVADYLRGLGYAVHHLGADLPLIEATDFLGSVQTDVVCVSITCASTPGVVRGLVRAVDDLGDGRVVVGGRGADQSSVEEAGGLYAAEITDLGRLLRA
jgi:excisionase family DNA binding protein